MALAIYRKYRPKKLEDVLGQEAVVQILKNAAVGDGVGHAYLFYGPRGSGKTSTARILAKIVNCLKRQSDKKFKAVGEPCNECQACREIDSGRAFDVAEIDAASNRGIDEIRDLKEGIRLSPALYKFKVFIIDEAHQLTKEAFNALLKTLEEPPEHAIFILATTEIDKMPATITSRSQRFHFKKIPLKTIVNKLKDIAKVEKIEMDEEAFQLIASGAEGSVRDAESLLDQVSALGTKVKFSDVEMLLGKVSAAKTAEFASILSQKDLKKALNYLSEINEGGYNTVQFTKDLIHYLRRVLSLKFSPALEAQMSKELTDAELDSIKKLSNLIDAQFAVSLIKSLIRAYSEMRYSPFATVPLEVAIIENLK